MSPPPELGHAERQADDGEHAAQRRGPDNGAVPERLVHPQRREVEPVRYRPDPGERPTAPRGQHRHFGRPSRDIELGAGGVVHPELVHRHLATLCQGPLIGLPQGTDGLDVDLRQTRKPTDHRAGGPGFDVAEQLSGVGEDGRVTEAVRRPTHDHEQRGTRLPRPETGPLCGVGRRQSHTDEVKGRQPLEPELRREAGHTTRVHHDDTGRKPQHEQRAERDAQVTVCQDQPASQQRHELRLPGGAETAESLVGIKRPASR